MKDQIYVLDTNVLVDYPDIIPAPGSGTAELTGATVDLSEAHLVIPSAVVRELSSFKREKSDRGKTARTVLKRLRELAEREHHEATEYYTLHAPIQLKDGRELSFLPTPDGRCHELWMEVCNELQAPFEDSVIFNPGDDDMDGQIIVTAMWVKHLIESEDTKTQQVTILTNDNGLAIRARERGLMTSCFGYRMPEPYTGRRDIVVPIDLFMDFVMNNGVDRNVFEGRMFSFDRSFAPLVANEFIIMDPNSLAGISEFYDPDDPEDFIPKIGRYDAELDRVVPLEYATRFPMPLKNPGQAIYAEALMHPDIAAVLCTGPAGCGKTFMATIWGYKACIEGRYIGVRVVPCESHSHLGALPGDLNEKMDPDVQPLKNAIRNYLLVSDEDYRSELKSIRKFGPGKKVGRKKCADKYTDYDSAPSKRSIKVRLRDHVDMIWENWFTNTPIDRARGRDFAYEFAIFDEFQDQSVPQADTLIKRLGTDGKIILTGDVEQIHAPYLDANNNGIVYSSRLLYDNPMVAQVHFNEDEVVRHPLVKIVAERQKQSKFDDDIFIK